MKIIQIVLLSVLLVPVMAPGQPAAGGGGSDADAKRFAEIQAKHRQGQEVTQEEVQFAMQYMAAHKGAGKGTDKGKEQQYAEYAKAHLPQDSTGMIPLTELGKGAYKGEEGGLYPGGLNTPPEGHLKAGLALAAQIAPLDKEGKKAADGKIVFLSIGMSNTTMEFQVFQKLAAGDKDLNPRLLIVDGAQGAQTAKVTAKPESNFWKVVDERLAKEDVTAKQVQAVWLKQANGGPTEPFPAEAKRLEQDVVNTLHILHARFPNLKIAYMSSRIYAGYASSPLNPEPHAYEGAFAYKWLIADQIAGKPELNYDPAKGEVKSPWVAWGPYLWADGKKARKDGLTYTREDVGADGTHPSESGRQKVGKLLLDFLKSDPTSRPWFLAGK